MYRMAPFKKIYRSFSGHMFYTSMYMCICISALSAYCYSYLTFDLLMHWYCQNCIESQHVFIPSRKWNFFEEPQNQWPSEDAQNWKDSCIYTKHKMFNRFRIGMWNYMSLKLSVRSKFRWGKQDCSQRFHF